MCQEVVEWFRSQCQCHRRGRLPDSTPTTVRMLNSSVAEWTDLVYTYSLNTSGLCGNTSSLIANVEIGNKHIISVPYFYSCRSSFSYVNIDRANVYCLYYKGSISNKGKGKRSIRIVERPQRFKLIVWPKMCFRSTFFGLLGFLAFFVMLMKVVWYWIVIYLLRFNLPICLKHVFVWHTKI